MGIVSQICCFVTLLVLYPFLHEPLPTNVHSALLKGTRSQHSRRKNSMKCSFVSDVDYQITYIHIYNVVVSQTNIVQSRTDTDTPILKLMYYVV